MAATAAITARLIAVESEIKTARLSGDASLIPPLIKKWRKTLDKEKESTKSTLEHTLLAEQAISSHSLDVATTNITEAYATLLKNKMLTFAPNIKGDGPFGLPQPPINASDMATLRSRLADSQLYFEIVVMKAEVLFQRQEYTLCLQVLTDEVDIPINDRPALNSLGVVYLVKAIVMKAVSLLYILPASSSQDAHATNNALAANHLRYLLYLFPQLTTPEIRFQDTTSIAPFSPQTNSLFPFSLPLEPEIFKSAALIQYLELGVHHGIIIWMTEWFTQVRRLQKQQQETGQGSSDITTPTSIKTDTFLQSLSFLALTHQILQFIRIYFVFDCVKLKALPTRITLRKRVHRRRIAVAQWGIRFLVVWLFVILEKDTEMQSEKFFAPYYSIIAGGGLLSLRSLSDPHKDIGASELAPRTSAETTRSSTGSATDRKANPTDGILSFARSSGYEPTTIHEEIDSLFDKWVCSVVEVVPFPDALAIDTFSFATEKSAKTINTFRPEQPNDHTVSHANEIAVGKQCEGKPLQDHYHIALSLYKPFYGNKLMEEFCDCLMWYDSLLMISPSTSAWHDSAVTGGATDATRLNRTLEILQFATRHTFHSLRIIRHLFTAFHRLGQFNNAITFFTRYVELAQERVKSSPDIAQAWFPPNIIENDELDAVFAKTRIQNEQIVNEMNASAKDSPLFVMFTHKYKARQSLRNTFLQIELPQVARFTGFVETEDGVCELMDMLILGSQLQAAERKDVKTASRLMDTAHTLLDSALLPIRSETASNIDSLANLPIKTLAFRILHSKGAVCSAVALETHDLSLRQHYQQKAIKLLQESLSKDPQAWEPYYHLALLHADRHELSQARKRVKTALKYNRTHVASWHLLVLLMTAHKDSDSALKVCELGLRECLKFYESTTLDGSILALNKDRGEEPSKAKFEEYRSTTMEQLALAAVNNQGTTQTRKLLPREYDEFMFQLFDFKYTQALILEGLRGPDATLIVCQELFTWFKKFYDYDFRTPEFSISNGSGQGASDTVPGLGSRSYANTANSLNVDVYNPYMDASARLRSSSVKSSVSSWSVNAMSPSPQVLAPLSTLKSKKADKRRSKLGQNMWSNDSDVQLPINTVAGVIPATANLSIPVENGCSTTDKTSSWDSAVIESRKSVDSTLTFGDVAALNVLSKTPYNLAHNLSTHSMACSIVSIEPGAQTHTFISSRRRTEVLVRLWLRSAQIAMRRNQYEEARKSLYEAERLDSLSVEVWSEMATYHFQTNNIDKAIQIWNRCLVFHPYYLPAQLGLGRAYLDYGNLVAAELILDDAVKRNGSAHVEAWYLFGKVHKANGDVVRAKECFQYALQLEKVNPAQPYQILPRFWPAF